MRTVCQVHRSLLNIADKLTKFLTIVTIETSKILISLMSHHYEEYFENFKEGEHHTRKICSAVSNSKSLASSI